MTQQQIKDFEDIRTVINVLIPRSLEEANNKLWAMEKNCDHRKPDGRSALVEGDSQLADPLCSICQQYIHES